MNENSTLVKKNILICSDIDNIIKCTDDYKSIATNFVGRVFDNDITEVTDLTFKERGAIFVCGNVSSIRKLFRQSHLSIIQSDKRIKIVQQLSYDHYPLQDDETLVGMDAVPIYLFDDVIYCRNYFTSNFNYFDEIKKQHSFLSLTESNKEENVFPQRPLPQQCGNKGGWNPF